MKKIKAVVLGSINYDCVAKGPRLPKKGETVRGYAFNTFVGGKGANQAVQLALLGADVTFIGRVGADDIGQTLRKSLDGHGINTAYLTVDDTVSSGACSINIDENGDNTLLYAPGANETLRKEDIDRAADTIRGADIFITQNEINLDAAAYGLEKARQFGAVTLLNPAPARPLDESVFPLLDYIVPNETETEAYCGFLPEDENTLARAADWFLQRGAGNVVITLGENGVYYANGSVSKRRGAYQVKAVDMTAAGDACIGGLSYIVGGGGDIDRALQYGNSCGALAVSKDGAQASLAGLREVEELIAANSKGE